MRALLISLVIVLSSCTVPEVASKAPAITADAKGVNLTPDAPQWKYVELKMATPGPALAPLPAPARVDFDEKRTANVGSPLAGRVESVAVRLGDQVKAGDRLFSVRSAAWADLDRDHESARAEVLVKQRVYERAKDLFELKAAPEKDMISAEADLRAAQLNLKAAEAKKQSLLVASAGDNLFWVKCPRSGTVVDLDVISSQEVSPERDKALVKVADLDEVLVLADLPENDVGELKVNAPVTIRTQVGGVERPGTVIWISEVIDARRRTVEVRVRAQNKDRALRPNAFVEVIAAADPTQQRIKVPDSAVVSEGPKSMLFVARGPGRLEPIDVVPGRRRDGEVEIRAGLEAGTRYVARGALLLLNQVDLAN